MSKTKKQIAEARRALKEKQESERLIAMANEELAKAKDEETRTALEELLEEKRLIGEWRAHSKKVADMEANLIYDLANSIDAIIADMEERYKHLGMAFKQEKKQAFTSFTDNVRKAHTTALVCFDADLKNAYGGDLTGMEIRRLQSNELIKLILLYSDRTAFSEQNYVDIMNFIIDMKGGADMIRQTDLDRFSKDTVKDDSNK